MALGVALASSSTPPGLTACSEEPMKVPCSPALAVRWMSTPPGLQACLFNRCASEGSTAEPSPNILSSLGSPRRPSSDSFSLPEGVWVSGEADVFSLYSSGLKSDQPTVVADHAAFKLQPVMRRSFSALCIEPSRLMMLRGDVEMQDRNPEAQTDTRSRGSMRTFDGLCLEFNPDRLPFLNANLHDSLPCKDEWTDIVEPTSPIAKDTWSFWAQGYDETELDIYGKFSDDYATMLPGCRADEYTEYTEDMSEGMHHDEGSVEINDYSGAEAHQWYQMLYGDAGRMEQPSMSTMLEYA